VRSDGGLGQTKERERSEAHGARGVPRSRTHEEAGVRRIVAPTLLPERRREPRR
jgi:hypothetical protein